MTNVVFKHPLTNNSLVNFDPSNKNHYPQKGEKGVYIYGLRLKIDGELKFIPIVVGESDDLHRRLFTEHYKEKFDNPLSILLGIPSNASGDAKEIWDFSKRNYQLNELIAIYNDLSYYDSQLYSRNKCLNVATLSHLIFFQNSDFFHLKHNAIPLVNKIKVKTENSIDVLINLINNGGINVIDVKQHIGKILSTLVNFRDNFYFVYAKNDLDNAELDFNNEVIRLDIEKQTKDKLKLINIHTTADAKSVDKTIPIKIDLSNVRNELINIGNHNYNDNGNYINPFII
jgi:hypothetical protein